VLAAGVLLLLASAVVPSINLVRRGGLTEQDGAQQRQVHAALVNQSRSNAGGRLLLPGLVNRRAVNGQQVPGQGDHDYSKDRTHCLYSAAVAMQLFPTALLLGPTEVNPVVRLYDSYNYAAYNPALDTYWDGDAGFGAVLPANPVVGLRARINSSPASTSPADVCHVSFAHQMLIGIRRDLHWRGDVASDRPLFATRGCKNGVTTGPDYDLSPTLRLHGPSNSWEGNACFGDNHVAYVTAFSDPARTYQCGTFNGGAPWPDNMFACGGSVPTEFSGAGCMESSVTGVAAPWAGGDAMLAIHPFATNWSGVTAIPQWDALTTP
jgi:hypothetical protein